MQKTEILFHKWNADRRLGIYESRLLANRLKARFQCTLEVAFEGMGALRPEDTFAKLMLDLNARRVPTPRMRVKMRSAAKGRAPETQKTSCERLKNGAPRSLESWLFETAHVRSSAFSMAD